MSAALALCAAATFGAPAKTDAQTTPARAASGATKKQLEAKLKLTPEEESLVRGSKAAIIETGFSERYFDAHFKLVRVYNSTGDRRVVWRFRLDGYETLVNDSVGFYTDASGRRIDSHMVSASLGRTRDIRRTIPFSRAQSAMKECIGEYGPGSVLLQRFNTDGRVSLVYTAVSLPPEGEPKTTPAAAGPRPDRPGEGGRKKNPFLEIGTIDLETGRCTKGVAQVGSPQAGDPQPAPRPGNQK